MHLSLVTRKELTMTNFKKSKRNFLRPGIAGTVVVMAVLAVALPSGSGLVRAADGGSPASYWHIGYYTSSPHGTLSFAAAPTAASGIASLNFTNQSNTALLVTNNKVQFPSLLGDLTGKSVSASFTVSGLTGIFMYYGEPDACGGTTAYMRYYFETSNASGFDETHYWWSNPVSAALTGNGPVSLPSVLLTGHNWSDFYGHFGDDPTYSAGFNAAVSNVTEIGLSFGGGCFFENGVGTTDGSGTFTLNSYTTS
jgi:hypothetical protein